MLDQCRTYVAAVRLAEGFGCETIGIQYQQGLKDLLPASDLVEGLLNNDDRPPVAGLSGRPIWPGRAIVHFNEVDECAGLDGLLTNRLHRARPDGGSGRRSKRRSWARSSGVKRRSCHLN